MPPLTARGCPSRLEHRRARAPARRPASLWLLPLAILACRSRSPAVATPAPKARAQASAARPADDPRGHLPLIDSHVHLTPLPESMALAFRIFDAVGVVKFAVKSAGSWGSPRYRATRAFAERLGARMAFFINLDWSGVDEPGWGAREAEHLARAMREGASGLKIFKDLGLGVRLRNGRLLAADDARLDPIYARAAELGAIIAWHIADPVAFFAPPTPDNERYDELSLAPDWSFYGGDFPSHAELLAARDRVLRRQPRTTFLGIHLAGYPERLDYVSRLLEACPNLFVDTSARIPEIGHHPAAAARRFFLRHQDRILFGTDLIVSPEGLQLGSVSPKPPGFDEAVEFYRRHRRYFESADRQFEHPTPIQGRWRIDGIDLPIAVLRKLYYDNADRLIFAPRRAYLRATGAKPAAATPAQ
ncbi:MAG: amidohydrolase family protein [Proteobacteria bacterium]|nr:amidohydrolase family protein [Pseudomonadota bacterium]